jgi:hypothetical protein
MPAVSPLRSWERLLRLLGRFLLGLGILYLFRTTAGPQWARKLFLQYARSANQLRDYPKWYNAPTHNCTTNIFQEINATRIPLANASRYDWRIMLPGKGDEMLYESLQHRDGRDALCSTQGASTHQRSGSPVPRGRFLSARAGRAGRVCELGNALAKLHKPHLQTGISSVQI